ncbi:MAG: helix-turn-helix domain-containing protein [Thermoanaerobaculia bacterium]|nr:helix-turn-helix domain-containing protein [Thermoanaerobaculia bacterium]
MKYAVVPDIATIAGSIGNPARSRIVLALMAGRALTATELSLEAEISPSTASAHLSKLCGVGLIRRRKQGRHRYFEIAGEQVAEIIEKLCVLANRTAPGVASGPSDSALRKARVCYDHLAGELGVRLFEGLVGQGLLELHGDGVDLTPAGEQRLDEFGIDVRQLLDARRTVCRSCLDWSVRRSHLAGGAGAAILRQIYQRRWAEKDLIGRTVRFSASGEREFVRFFGI